MTNNVELQGNLGKQPEIHTTKDGKEFATLSIATSSKYFDDKAKEWKETDPQWFKAVAWNPLEVSEAKHLDKGSLVHLKGRLQNNSYDDKDGQKRESVEIAVTSLSEIVRRKK
ncbi:MAG: single-stranded DNA-binding protein [Candidatus Pacebacteria bacterium]|nr:single-stranded DNA-binding protein [Candidatus Paceibacterota bacterium]